jgi:predicted kinase
MRKWMSDRMKRRKKPGEAASQKQAGTPSPEPLQPKYFEAEVNEKQPVVASEPPARAARPETQADFQLTRTVPGPVGDAPPADTRTGPTRRRRKRGGGRGGEGRVGGRRSAAPGKPGVAAPEATPVEVTTDSAASVLPESQTEDAQLGEQEAVAETLPTVAIPAPAIEPAEESQSAALAAQAGAAQVPKAAATRPSKGTVVLAIGLPGSGKSSWFKRHNIHPLSSDLLRELLFDDAQEQRFQDLVFSNLRSMLKARLIARRPMSYVDATNLTPHDRHSWIKLAKDYGYEVQGLFFDVPVEICLERHQRRGRVVPEDVMRKMAAKLKPPTFEEGFAKITVVRVKQKDAAAS